MYMLHGIPLRLLFLTSAAVVAFVQPPSSSHYSWQTTLITFRSGRCCSSSSLSSGNINDDPDYDRMEQLRILLEASWNQPLMGNIPTTPIAAANEIALCMQSVEASKGCVSVVDLQLPSLDLRQGTRWYDAVLTADLAQLLVERLFQQEDRLLNKALLLVRDEATVRTIKRVWNTRSPILPLEGQIENDDDDDDNDDNNSTQEYDQKSLSQPNINQGAPLIYDDFADFGFVESFAQTEVSNTKSKHTKSPISERIKLMSLFGDASISEGADMEDQVIRSLQANVVAYLKKEQKLNSAVDTIVVIAPITRSEIMAVRAMVQTYSHDMRIILINPHIPTPRPIELKQIQIVYSLRPFLVRNKESQETITKVVVLKRENWELFISNKNHFERLQVAIPKTFDAVEGPSMEWVASCIQHYLHHSNHSGDMMDGK